MSKSVYPERDKLELLHAAGASNLFPEASANHVQRYIAAKKLSEEVSSLNALKRRQGEREERYNHELELDRLRTDLETSRLPGLRGTAARIGQLERLITRMQQPDANQ